ncbi:hypothetical protein [Microbacterium sp. AG790]|nr:hypothetical protein [Microbacterium sp. AG790]
MTSAPPPSERPGNTAAQTAAIPTGWRSRWHPRVGIDRVIVSAPAIAQIVIAATAAFSFAH